MGKSRYPLITLKGMAMGAADVVPGISGGTVAFITGVYEELIESVKNVDLTALRLLGTLKIKQFWKKINGNFLAALALGIAISIFSLATTMRWLLENRPIATWSFFFGLIMASSIFMAKQVTRWNAWTVFCLVAGVAAGYLITALSPTTTPETWWFIMLSGAIAVCAMILPAISGSFILLLLGKYHFMMTAISELNISVLLLFAVGVVAGITSFSHLLSWLLRHYHNIMVATLTGVIVGSLNKLWPWRVDDTNVLPAKYLGDPMLVHAIVWCVAGFALIFAIEYASKRIGKKRA